MIGPRETFDLPLHYFDRPGWVPTGREGREKETLRDSKGRRYWTDEEGREFVWSDRRKGVIAASYSADTIQQEKLRKPVDWDGRRWVSMGGSSRDTEVKMWEVVPLERWTGPGRPTSYGRKADDHADRLTETDWDDCGGWGYLRCDPLGFYHGMRGKNGRTVYVIRGPAALFRPACGQMPWQIVEGDSRQPTLF